MLFITFSKLSFLVSLYAVTINVESVILANITESVTSSHGVPSIIIKSYFSFNFSSKNCICGATNNSDGFGGILPAVITCKFSISVFCTYFEISIFSLFSISISAKQLDNPGLGDIPNIVYCLPFLISASIKTTLFPACANVTAKLEETQLFPSPGNVDVTNKVFNFLLVFINCIFVLNVLNASDIGDLGVL